MEKCSNCGGAVRPGAKFCTSCGTRLNNDPDPTQPAWSQGESVNETQVATPAVQPTDRPQDATPASASNVDETSTEESTPFSTWRRGNSDWGTASDSPSETPSGTTSPADRFEAALDSEPAAEPVTENASPEPSRSDWGKPASESTEDRFASWAAAYSSASGEETTGNDAVESATITPATSDAPAYEASAPTTDAAGFSGSDEQEIDYLSGDENITTGRPDSGIAAGTLGEEADVRQRASALVEELRGLIWTIGETDPVREGDTTDVLNGLTGARGKTSDFSDLENVIAAVRESPKDVDTLRELGKQAERLEALLDSHSSLTGAVDEAIRKLR